MSFLSYPTISPINSHTIIYHQPDYQIYSTKRHQYHWAMVRFNKYRKSYTIDSVQNSTCCPHCGIEYYSAKALTTHVSNRCTSNPLLQSNSYTRSYITKQINEGVINPHTSDFQNHALYNKPSLSVQASLNKASDSIDDIADVDYCSNDVDYGCDQTNYTTENEMTEMEENW